MQTLTIQINNRTALKAIQALESQQAIRIVEDTDIDLHSPALGTQPLTLKAFKAWIAQAEAAPSVSLKAAMNQWAKRKKQLEQLSK
jgi:hypothetical protein